MFWFIFKRKMCFRNGINWGVLAPLPAQQHLNWAADSCELLGCPKENAIKENTAIFKGRRTNSPSSYTIDLMALHKIGWAQL